MTLAGAEAGGRHLNCEFISVIEKWSSRLRVGALFRHALLFPTP